MKHKMRVFGFVLVAMMFLGIAAPANAATAYPDGWSPKQAMVNMLSSVMAKAGSTKAQRAILANSSRYDHGFETLEQDFKAAAATNVPNTYTDRVMAAQESFMQTHTTSKQGELATDGTPKVKLKGGDFKAPATTASNISKVVGGVVTLVFAVPMGVQLGAAADRMVGVDVTGGLCAGSKDGIYDFVNNTLAALSGSDCANYNLTTALRATPNDDLLGVLNGHDLCVSGACAHYLASVIDPGLGQGFCFKMDLPGTLPGGSTGWEVDVTGDPSGTADTNGSPGAMAALCASKAPTYNAVARSLAATATVSHMLLVLYGGPSQLRSDWSPTSADQVKPDPDRTLVCTITNSDGSTSEGVSLTWKEGGAGGAPRPTCPAVPASNIPVDTKISERTPGQADTVLQHQPTTPEYQAWKAAYPECATGACPLDLVRNSDQVSCFDNNTVAFECSGWFVDPAKNTKYQCMYGPHPVAMTECNLYADALKPEKVTAGSAYSDPLDGSTVQGQSSPDAAQIALGRTILAPDDFAGCLDAGWAAFNPVEWILTPIECGLQWAFVPNSDAVQAQVTAANHAWDATVFGKIGALVAPFNSIPVYTGCAGIPIDTGNITWPVVWRIQWTFGAACTGPMATTATVFRTLGGGLLGGGAILTLTNYLGSGIGWRGLGRRS